MKSTNFKRSIVLKGHKTSVSLETEFWESLREIASSQKAKLSTLMRQIDEGRHGNNLSSAIRVFVLNHLRAQITGVRTDQRIPTELPIGQRRLYA
jgi:predicted DNA-binding ribbon-helix-helix protein